MLGFSYDYPMPARASHKGCGEETTLSFDLPPRRGTLTASRFFPAKTREPRHVCVNRMRNKLQKYAASNGKPHLFIVRWAVEDGVGGVRVWRTDEEATS